MATIAIIDDNPDHSGTILQNMEIAIAEYNSDLKVIARLPFKDPNHYFDFINEHDICVLILDEKLGDKSIGDDGPVSYKGSELVSLLRKSLKVFPIFSITSFADIDDLNNKYSEFEDIIKRSEFIVNTNKYFPKILRAANKYLETNNDELSEFNKLTTEVSGGKSDPELIKKLQALQVKLDLPLSGFDNRTLWLNEYEKQINLLEELTENIKSKSRE